MHRLCRRRLAVSLALLTQIIVAAQNRLTLLAPLRRLVEFHGDTHPHQLSINAANISDQIKTANSIATNSIARFITNDHLTISPRTPPRTYPDSAEEVRAATHPRGGGRKRALAIWPGSEIIMRSGRSHGPCSHGRRFRSGVYQLSSPSAWASHPRLPPTRCVSLPPPHPYSVDRPSGRRPGYPRSLMFPPLRISPVSRHPWTECRGRCGGSRRPLRYTTSTLPF